MAELFSNSLRKHLPAAIQPTRDGLGVVGLGLCVIACATGRWVGVPIGIAVFVIGVPASPLVAFAVGQLGLVIALPDVGVGFAVGQLGLLLLLTEPVRRLTSVDRGWQTGTTIATAGAFIVLSVVTWALLSGAIWIAAIGLVGVVAGGVYGCHRFGLVRLGLVENTPAAGDDTAD